MELSKPGLSYNPEENTFQNRVRDWVVSLPETGFLFPAFGFDLVFSQNQGLRRLFVLLCQLCESFVDTFYHFYIAVLAKGVLDGLLR